MPALASQARIFLALVLAPILFALPSPKQTSENVQEPSSADSVKKTDLAFLKRGVTTRREVEERLGWADAGIRFDRLFLARWMLSKAHGVLPRYALTEEDEVRENNRDWKSESVLLKFDSAGLLEDYKVLDGAHFIPALGAWVLATGYPAVDLSQPLELSIGYPVAYLPLVTDRGRLILTPDAIELAGTAHGLPGFHMPRTSLLKVAEDHWWDTERGQINCRLTFDEKLRAKVSQFPSANPMLLRFDAQDLVIFLRYLAQSGYSFVPR